VDEAEWLACTDPAPLLIFLRGKVSDRKLRLFAVACCRRLWHLLEDERSRTLVELCEAQAHGPVNRAELALAFRGNYEVLAALHPRTARAMAVRAVTAGCGGAAWAAAWNVVSDARLALHLASGEGEADESQVQAALLRDIIRNPFRPLLVDPAWLRWKGGTVRLLAEAAYQVRRLPEGTLRPGHLAILADALEESGCAEPELAAHLRAPGPHVRGCWAVDALTARG
jgi:hypothetical protein